MGQPRRQVALCLHDLTGFTPGLCVGVAAYHQTHGHWSLMVRHNTGQGLERILQRWAGDGLICSVASEAEAAYARSLPVAVVNVTGTMLSPGLPSVIGDDRATGQLGADHFFERGFRHFACLGADQLHFARTREEAFAATVNQRGGQLLPGMDLQLFLELSWAQQLDQLQHWLLQMPRPVAVFAVFDPLAQLVVEACHRSQLRVPEDVAILGVDNNNTLCELSHPTLSSIDPAFDRRGYEAAALLDRLMEGQPPPDDPIHIAPAGVVTRRSTDIFAVDDPKVREALSYIAHATDEHLHVDDVAQAVSMSRRNLERRFARAMGRTVYDEIRRRRLETAKSLLRDVNRPMLEVALSSGFASSSDLSNAFRRHVGMTPTAYRNRFAHRP